jgi:RND family efflux transporter MFP subunit
MPIELALGMSPVIGNVMPIVRVVGTVAALFFLSFAVLGLVVMLVQWRRASRIFVRIILPLVVVAIAGWAMWWLITTRDEPQRVEREQPVTPVIVEFAAVTSHAVVVEEMGEVQPARQVVVRPQVSGLLVDVNPGLVPGGRLRAGETIAKIDSRDYDLAVDQAETAVEQADARVKQAETAVKLAGAAVRQAKTAVGLAQAATRTAETAVESAKAELELEKGRQLIARREWSMLGEDVPKSDVSSDLALRKPQLRIVEAAVEAARERRASAKLEVERVRLQLERARFDETRSQQQLDSAKLDKKQAKLQLDVAKLSQKRTAITAPFNATVIREDVDLGQLVNPQSALATLVGTDRFWVQTAVPLARLERLRLPDAEGKGGSTAVVRLATSSEEGDGEDENQYKGRIVRVLTDTDPRSRMARLLVEVEDPLRLKTGGVPLLSGSYVRVALAGRPIENAAEIRRPALREGRRVWLMTDDGTLAIRQVKVAWRRKDTVLVRGLRDGDRVIDSSIAAPVPGMKLRVDTLGSKATTPATAAPAPDGSRTSAPEESR